mgnify:CR=1 FL=1
MKAVFVACAFGVAFIGAAVADTIENGYDNTIVVTTADGAQLRYHFEPDGSYTMRTPDGETASGAWRYGDDEICFSDEEGANETCAPYVDDKAVGDTWTQAGTDGSTVTVSIVAGRE